MWDRFLGHSFGEHAQSVIDGLLFRNLLQRASRHLIFRNYNGVDVVFAYFDLAVSWEVNFSIFIFLRDCLDFLFELVLFC